MKALTDAMPPRAKFKTPVDRKVSTTASASNPAPVPTTAPRAAASTVRIRSTGPAGSELPRGQPVGFLFPGALLHPHQDHVPVVLPARCQVEGTGRVGEPAGVVGRETPGHLEDLPPVGAPRFAQHVDEELGTDVAEFGEVAVLDVGEVLPDGLAHLVGGRALHLGREEAGRGEDPVAEGAAAAGHQVEVDAVLAEVPPRRRLVVLLLGLEEQL